jgi:hypothetical protein
MNLGITHLQVDSDSNLGVSRYDDRKLHH